MRTDPKYREIRRAYGRRYYAESAERRQQVRRRAQEWSKRQRQEHRQEIRDRDRMDRQLRIERLGVPQRTRKHTVIDGTSPRVLAEPFRKWWLAYIETIEETSPTAALQLGIDPRRIYGLLKREFPNISLDIVDRALTNCQWTVQVDGKMIVTLDDLYEAA
jgi:hypothetical protein